MSDTVPDKTLLEYRDALNILSPALIDTVVTLRSEVIEKLVEFRNESRHLCDQIVHFKAAVDRLGVGLETALASLSSRGSHSQVKSLLVLRDDAIRASAVLYERGEQVQKMSKDLSTSEDRLRRKESSLYRKLSQARAKQSLNGASLPDDTDEESPSDAANSEAAPLPLVQDYYDKVSYADGLREDFLNFRANHYQERRRRSRLRKLHEPVTPSESEFLRDYFSERSARFQEFSAALAAARQLRDDCLQEGNEVDDVGIPPLEDEDIIDDNLLIPQAIVERSASEKEFSRSPENFDALFVDIDPKRHVTQWLQAVSQEERTESETVPHRETAVLQEDRFDHLQSTDKNLYPPNFRRERSVSQPPPSDLTAVQKPGDRILCTQSRKLCVDSHQPRPKSAPIILYIHGLTDYSF